MSYSGRDISSLPLATSPLGLDAMALLQELVEGSPSSRRGSVQQLADASGRVLRKRRLQEFGTVNDEGGGDNTAVLNYGMAETAGNGERLIVDPGVLRTEGPLVYPDGLNLSAYGATFERRFSSGVAAWITQADYDAAIRIQMRGGRWWNPDPDNIQGNSFDLRCDDSLLWDFVIDEWGDGGRALLFAGNRNLLGKIRAISVHDGGGLRCNGVLDTTIAFCRVKCGDDCLMFNTTTNPAARYATLHNRRSQYIGCEGESWNARVCIVEAYSAGSGVVIASECTDLGFYAIKGKGRAAAFIGNNKSSGVLGRITLRDVAVDCSAYAVPGTAGLYILSEGASGGVEEVLLDNVVVLSPYQENLRVKGPVRRSMAIGGSFTAPQTAGSETVLIEDGADFRMERTHVQGRSDYLPVSVRGTPCRAFFEKLVVSGIGDARSGINITTLSAGGIDECRFLPADGATTSRAISMTAGAEGLVVGKNDYSALAVAVRVVWPEAANAGCRIYNPQIIKTSAAVTTRAYLSGATYVLQGATGRTLALPGAGGGLCFGGVQQGTGALRIQALAGDVIQVGALVSTAGGYIETASVGAAVWLEALDEGGWQATAFSGSWVAA